MATSALNENTRFKDGRPCHTGTGWSSQILPWTHLEGIYMQQDATQLIKTGSKQAKITGLAPQLSVCRPELDHPNHTWG